MKIVASRSQASRLLVLAVTGLTALTVAGCGAAGGATAGPDTSPTAPPTTAPGGDLSGACATVTAATATSAGVPVCTVLHPDGVALRLPAAPSDGRGYGGFTRDGLGFVTADGTTHSVSQDIRDRLPAAVDAARVPDYAHTAYLATFEDQEVVAVVPALRIDHDAMVRTVFAGTTMVGEISPVDTHGDAHGDHHGPTYSGEPSLPVVVTWSDQLSADQLSGTITNATAPVSVGGTCAPALSAAADDPLVGGFGAAVGLMPHASLHGTWDDELVFLWNLDSTGAGAAYYPSVATLMGAEPLQGTWEVQQDGDPASGPRLELQIQPEGTTVAPC